MALLLATACSTSGGGDEPAASAKPTDRAGKAGQPHRDDPNLLRGFRSWLKTNDSPKDDKLAGHTLSIRLSYDEQRDGVVEVLTDYGPWGEAEGQVGPLAAAFTEWWDKDPAAGRAYFLSQGGRTVQETVLYRGTDPDNLLKEFLSWTAKNATGGGRLAPHITSLGIGYADSGNGVVTVSTDYLTYRDASTQKNLNAVSEAFAAWWDGDDGASSVTVKSQDEGSSTTKKLAVSS
ncbi:hypothetical protein [Streptomyces sp. NPDC087300]|uniref:hypothetical protein n=1 Tax=Streptomyces sp. NPDC087300 TaxID=3365780 RepID=UPI00381463DA